ncbi:hypothetical protein K2173_007080 [Erythroxylum novogranatense]|uniref:Protein kinase domain-containing protein n=1 Tax=Erythroxylum novogranatense TaxID=1862640 RepID=A0AAV8SZH2_9ROSI|nr:hypothetical protein K2173_007080 [Erythroxylum novogranatense]
MGCICSKGTPEEDFQINENSERQKESEKFSVQLIAPFPSKREEIEADIGRKEGSVRRVLKANGGSGIVPLQEFERKGSTNENRQTNANYKRSATMDLGGSGDQRYMGRIVSIPHSSEGELIVAGWPQWLTSVAGEAIKGWLPRPADSFKKLEKIGQGTYSTVYRALDLETGKTVAMKKVRFVSMDPESVRFMAREIHILRKLDHPNVLKLEAIVTSTVSGSLYLVFEYMEHDLAGLAGRPGIKFTEPQIKCYMQQLLRGIEHCHSRGILHRDIKGSNLLINNSGLLKIGDFGLANFFKPDQSHALTSRVVTLWYRAPELLLGCTQYGAAIDLWSIGCIVAELFAGKPIMPGRTEVEQMHKIFKLCGSPSEDFWQKTKLPHATSFKPQFQYKRCVYETFKNFPPTSLALVDKLLAVAPKARGSATSALQSEFFKTEPLPCEPSSIPKYPPSKELDAKMRDEEERRRRAEAVKGRGPESVRRGTRDVKTPEFVAQGQSKITSTSNNYDLHDGAAGPKQNGFSHSMSVAHPCAVEATLSKNVGSARSINVLRAQKSHLPQASVDMSNSSLKKPDRTFSKDSTVGYGPRKNRIHYSGPLMPPGGNMEDLLKEHERQIQQAVRKARLEKY